MRPISVFLNEQKRCRLFGLTAACLLVLFQLCSVQTAVAAGGVTITVEEVHSVICGGSYDCCLKVTVTVAANAWMTSFDITSINCAGTCTDRPGDCWDLDCAIATGHQYLSNGTISSTTGPDYGTGAFGFIFDPVGVGIAGPGTFEFIICPKAACAWTEWSSMTWSAYTGVNLRIPHWAVEGGDFGIGGSCDNAPLCPICDEVDIRRPNDCYEIVCFTRHWPANDGPSCTYNVKIQPPLQSCNYPPGGTSCDNTMTQPRMEDGSLPWALSGPTHHAGPPAYDTWTITGCPPIDLTGCSSFCFDIPTCTSGAIPHTITISNPSGTACDSSGSATFKIGTGSSVSVSDEGLQNYPNPLSAANAFKSVIPFEVANGGTAKITLFDETGRTVYTDAQNFDGAGKHFFYFTGSQLPAGKYFYSIESPLGVMIVQRNLLIVK